VKVPDWRRYVPPVARRAVGSLRTSRARSSVTRELQRLAATRGPIIAGPWLGEVGFEVLYWVPFLQWAVETAGLDPARIIAVSRGGPQSWYQRVSARYADAFDYFDVEQFRNGNARRGLLLGEQKQLRPTDFDDNVVAAVKREHGLAQAEVLHPSLMYRMYQPYWWKHTDLRWFAQCARYQPMERPPLPADFPAAPGSYVAAKFYFNDCMHATPETRQRIADAMMSLAGAGPVVSLNTGIDLDDHVAASDDQRKPLTISGMVTPRNNLQVQTAVVANARAFVGTYGGFSYIAPFHGVPSLAIYDDEDGFDAAHLRLARHAFSTIGSPGLTTMGLTDQMSHRIGAFIGGGVH
jgi:hypothetical protein